MSFSEPPPPPYYSPPRNTVRTITTLILLVVVIILVVFLYLSYKKFTTNKCTKNSDCSGSTPKCSSTGTCVQCVRTTDCIGGTFCSTANTVSYTHLDVYKRQLLYIIGFLLFYFIIGKKLRALGKVCQKIKKETAQVKKAESGNIGGKGKAHKLSLIHI